MTDPADIDAWLRLLSTPEVGRGTARRLLAAFGSAQAVVSAPRAAAAAVAGPAIAERLEQLSAEQADLLQRTHAWLAADPTRRLLTLGDDDYPPALLHSADPPLLLYAQGRLELLRRPLLAIVGSRHPTPQGADNARQFARRFSDDGITVVSGLALGIDAAAHEGALDGSGSTIAVVGTGLDRVYPSRHRALAHRIAEQGLVLGEMPLGTLPLPSLFPQRNRIIAGLSLGTLVVEAAVQSGSLITARLAAEGGRDVFAIPGSIHSPLARGCHALIKQGAKLVESADDVLHELQSPASLFATPVDAQADRAAGDDDPLLRALGHDPATLDSLLARTGLPAERLQAQLLALELDGRVARLPGGLFQRRQHA